MKALAIACALIGCGGERGDENGAVAEYVCDARVTELPPTGFCGDFPGGLIFPGQFCHFSPRVALCAERDSAAETHEANAACARLYRFQPDGIDRGLTCLCSLRGILAELGPCEPGEAFPLPCCGDLSDVLP